MITWLIENKEAILMVVTTAIALASAISAMTPNTTDDTWVAKIKGIVDKIALNIGHAKNATPPEDTPEE